MDALRATPGSDRPHRPGIRPERPRLIPGLSGEPAKPRWDLDVAAAADFMRGRGVASVALVGSNVGGIASLVAAGQIEPSVAAIVVLSAQVEMSGLDGLAAAAAIKVPVLYLMSSSDEYLGEMQTLAGATRAPIASRWWMSSATEPTS